MALGDYNLFTWKSKETQEKEQEEYAKWAFPYGQQQRDSLQELLGSLLPRESGPSALIQFLTCKELYEGFLKKADARDAAIDTMINRQKRYKQIIKRKNMTMLLALVLADAEIDELCLYPHADKIREHAAELEKNRTDD